MNFIEEKLEYLRDVKENAYILSFVKAATASAANLDPEVLEDYCRVIESPETEKELKFAKATFAINKDMIYFLQNVSSVKPIPIEENTYANFAVDLINAGKNDSEKFIINVRESGSKYCAEFVYSSLVGMATDPEEVFNYIFDKTGYDRENEEDLKEFESVLVTIKEKSANITNQLINKRINDYPDEYITGNEEFSAEFHRLVEEGMKKEKDTSDDLVDYIYEALLAQKEENDRLL